MGQTLLVEQIQDGEKLVRAILEEGAVDVQAAFWIAEEETSQPYLHVVSADVLRLGRRETYGKIRRVIRTMNQPFWIQLDDVKLIDPSRPLAQEVLQRLKQHPGPYPLRAGGAYLGGDYVDQYYIYPSSVLVHS